MATPTSTAIVSSPRTPYKPRYSIAYLAKSKVWPYKNSRLRRFYSLRGRRLQRGGLFRRYVLVSTTRKWTIARRVIRPFSRRGGAGNRGGGKTAFGRPQQRRYRDSFYRKQQLRAFHGKITESYLRRLVQNYRTGSLSSQGDRSRSFFSVLESRLDRVLFRRRLRPTIYACHQFIRHCGVNVNGGLETSPAAFLRVGDTVSLLPNHETQTTASKTNTNKAGGLMAVDSTSLRRQRWRATFWDLFCRTYYRRWGLYLLRRRRTTQLKKKVRLFSSRFRPIYPIFSGLSASSKRSEGAFSILTANSFSNTSSFRAKFRHYRKLSLAVRLRKSFLPRVTSNVATRSPSYEGRFSRKFAFEGKYLRSYRRSNVRRFLRKRRTKLNRNSKLARLQPVHMVFPSYRQRDLRTLRRVLVHTPTPDESNYAFRGSAAQVYAFYRSRGR